MNEAFAHCGRLAHAGARDRWLGALFAPERLRPHLHALIAFELEMERVREAARDPRAGEIRLAWWRDALSHRRDDEARGHPVASALLETLDAFRPPPHLIENAIVARQFDLYDDPCESISDLEAYLGETRSSLLQIAALVLAQGRDPGAAEASGLAGVALGLVDWLSGLARPRPLPLAPREILARHGSAEEDFRERRMTPGLRAALRDLSALARRRLREAETARAALRSGLAPAYCGLATAPLRLDAAERGWRRAFEAPAEVAAWRRQWALWRWSKRR